MPNAVPAKVGLGSILVAVMLSSLLAVSVAGGAAYWLIRSGKLTGEVKAVPAAAAAVVVPVASHVVALEPMVVNLADADGRSYLRAAVSLRIRDEVKPKGEAEEKPKDKTDTSATAALRDSTLSVLSDQTAQALSLPKGREALKKKLSEEYVRRNAEITVMEVYFTDFLVQRG